MDNILDREYYTLNHGLINLNQLIKRTRPFKIPIQYVKQWYNQQLANQVFKSKPKIAYHKTISDGYGYQADIIFLAKKKGYIGLLTFINTTTRYAYAYPIKTRQTEEIIARWQEFIDTLKGQGKRITSVSTDNEFYNNRNITNLLHDNGIHHYVEDSGQHYKLGIINRFHRTLRDMFEKYYIVFGKPWIDVYSQIIDFYNQRYHSTLGKSPQQMTQTDIIKLNHRLRAQNESSIKRLNQFHIGDKVRYLIKKGVFQKGGDRYSKDVYVVDDIINYNLILKKGEEVIKKRYYELIKVN